VPGWDGVAAQAPVDGPERRRAVVAERNCVCCCVLVGAHARKLGPETLYCRVAKSSWLLHAQPDAAARLWPVRELDLDLDLERQDSGEVG